MPDEDFLWMQQCLEDHPLVGEHRLFPALLALSQFIWAHLVSPGSKTLPSSVNPEP
jgi:hypothetical protein